MTKLSLALTLCLGWFYSQAPTLTTNWTIDNNYKISFSATGAKGTFKGLTGSITFDSQALETASMKVRVATNTISTGNKTKDKHAKGKSWFHVEKYPTIQFNSTQFSKSNTGYLVKGNLTMHGVTQLISIPFTFSETSNGGMFQGSFKLNRKDFKIYGPAFGFIVSNEIKIDLQVPVSS